MLVEQKPNRWIHREVASEVGQRAWQGLCLGTECEGPVCVTESTLRIVQCQSGLSQATTQGSVSKAAVQSLWDVTLAGTVS